MDKSPDAFRTISEAADDLGLPQHVLRFWETRFPQIKPLKRGGGRRYYRPDDVELLRAVKQLLYDEGYTIKGVQRLFKEQGPRAVVALKAGDGVNRVASDPGVEFSAAAQTDLLSRSKEDNAMLTHNQESGAFSTQAAFSVADLRALRAALADIDEGERILTTTRAG
jgi:DNA-binding transcriptional MerR regulator